MKAIAVIEILEGGKGKWYIDGQIRYTENKSLMKKFDEELISLKPLPEEEEPTNEVVEIGSYNEGYGNGYECGFADGWNACLKEITK